MQSAMAKRSGELGVKPELEVFELGHLALARQMLAEGLLALARCSRLQQIRQAFGFHEIERAVDECAPGELARISRPHALLA